ncbi:M48 family metallopeptidase [Nocardioides renjunii]|uniref:M48 family metallopeptidase n=1 Tax=Nocardioides renjunii TaxID=3095075 RepID=UPI002AFF90DC|nr:M48 family metallopeptidase [Nocardioides sp. S-34]WQQ21842.1 M48 family metallopeptidase [Nocardioides sp. S-34]
MLARLRTAVAIAMLVGIFVLAAGVLGGLVVALVWVLRNAPAGAAGLGFLLSSVGFVLVVALLRVFREATPDAPDGVALPPEREPALWSLVRQAAEAVATRPPDEIRLVADANAAVSEDSRWLGLVPGTRILYVGVPLLQTLTRSQLVFVLGHEMGHYSERHTALSGVTRRGLVALVEVVDGFGPRRPLGRLFGAYLALYARVVRAVARGQELDADRWAAALAGPEASVSALRAIVGTAASWDRFVQDHASVGNSVGMVPRGVFAGYAQFLSVPAHRDVDVDRMIAEERRSPLDTHPPTARRVQRIEKQAHELQTAAVVPDGDEPALRVLTDPVGAIAEVEAHIARESSLTPVAWEGAAEVGGRRRNEERAVRVMSLVDSLTPEVADLSLVVHLATHGRRRELAERLAGHGLDDPQALDLLRSVLELLVRCALVGAGHATYVHRWDRPDVVVDEAGTEVDVAGLVEAVPGNPAGGEWLLEVLRAEGISRTWNPAVSSRVQGPAGPEVLAVVVTKQNWRYAHPVLYVTDAGLAIRTLGHREYHSIPPISPQKTPEQLLEHSTRVDGLRLLVDPTTELVPWDEVEHVTYVDGARPRLTVRRSGRTTSYSAVGVAGDVVQAFGTFVYGRISLG